MAADITSDDFVAKSSDVLAAEEAALKAAHEKALAELSRIKEKVTAKGTNLSPYDDFEMYDINGVGRYVIMDERGWEPLIELIGYDKRGDYSSLKAQRSIIANIDFSANIYPNFDGIIGEHFQSPYLLDPLHDKFMSYKNLRDNLAAVRNFLMQTYFANTPQGMTNEKARESLEQIAAYVGDGLYNNYLFLGLIPNHDPRKPFIDIERAKAPNGEGAQYIYEKILEMQRQSSWLRPFDAVKALFGGKKLHDWQLPSSDQTSFVDVYGEALGPEGKGKLSTEERVSALNTDIAVIEAKLQAIRDARALSIVATDLDSIGNHLIYTASHMDGVAQLSDPIRRDAVDIAHDILRKLKLSIGNLNVMDGLKLKPSDDMAALGGIKGVVMVYERLLAWARANNDTAIFQHPSVLAATQAIGQLGYQAKREALRMAELAKNGVLASGISEQIKRLPSSYTSTWDTKFSGLLDKIENGMNTILNRTQQVSVSGAKVGHSLDSSMGSTVSAQPTAGISQQTGVDGAQRNAQLLAAEIAAQQAQAHRMHSQMAAQARQSKADGQQAVPLQPAPRGAGTAGRQSQQNIAAARQQQRQNADTSSSLEQKTSTTPLNPAQQQLASRQAAAAAAAEASRRREEQQRLEQQRLQLRAQQDSAARNAQRAAQRAAMTMDPATMNQVRAATSLTNIPAGTPVVTGGRRIDPASIRGTTPVKSGPQTQQPAATMPNATAGITAPKIEPAKAQPDDKITNPNLPNNGQSPRGGGRGY